MLKADEYDLSGDCEPSCSCYRTDSEFFCETCLRVIPYAFIKERFPDFHDYCGCEHEPNISR